MRSAALAEQSARARLHPSLILALAMSSRQLGGALLGAPVSACSHLRRPKGQGGRVCAGTRFAFAPLCLRSSSPAPYLKTKTDEGEKNPRKHQSSSSDTRSEIPCRYFFKKKSCKICTLQCVKTTSLRLDAILEEHVRHVEAEGKPSKKSKKGGAKGTVALLKESTQLGCVSQDSYPRKSILREDGKVGSKHAVKFSEGTGHLAPHKNSGKRVHREELSKSVNLMSAVLARPALRTSQEETLHQ